MKLILGWFILLVSTVSFANIRVVPGSIIGFDAYPDQLDRIYQSFETMEAVLNSEEFKKRILTYPGKGNKGFTNRKGLTHQQIYDLLMSGKELVNGSDTLNEMNFDIQRYYFGWYYRKKVVAATEPGLNNVIKVSEWFYSDYKVHHIAGNLTHEWIHLMGFYHKNSKDIHSVPYAIGNIMKDLAKKYLTQGHI